MTKLILFGFAVMGPGSIQYTEQEWYLNRYGTSGALIKFFLRHNQWQAALELLLQRQMDPEMFVNSILLPAFRNSEQTLLFNCMASLDPTLEVFKVGHLQHIQG